MSAFRIAVLASGSGTNLQAILDRLHGQGRVEVVAVGSDKPDAVALERAERAGIGTRVFAAGDYGDRESRDAAIATWLDGIGVDLVVLAGYMQLLSGSFIERFRERIINVHPALLPSFPGLDAIGQALRHGVKVSGVTIHFVDAGVDTGPVILQEPIRLGSETDAEAFEAEVHRVEHELLPRAIELIASDRVQTDEANPRVVRILED